MRPRILLSLSVIDSWVLDMNLCSKIKDEKDFVAMPFCPDYGRKFVGMNPTPKLDTGSLTNPRNCQKSQEKIQKMEMPKKKVRKWIMPKKKVRKWKCLRKLSEICVERGGIQPTKQGTAQCILREPVPENARSQKHKKLEEKG